MPLALTADLTLTSPAGEITLLGRDATLRVQLASLAQLPPLARLVPGGRRGRARALDRLDRMLKLSDIDLRFEIGDRLVARMGPAAAPGFGARLLGWAPVELRPGALLRALISRTRRRAAG